MADYGWSFSLEETTSIGNIARRQGKSYGTTSRNFDGNEMYITHTICSSDTLQGIALKHGVSMEHLRRVNKLWASDSIHLRKLLLIPIAVPLDGSTSRSSSRSDNGSPATGSPEPVFRDSNFPAGSRENPLNKAEAMQLLKSYDNTDRPGTPDSTSTSSSDATLPSEPVLQTPMDFFAKMDQSIASCRKNQEVTATNWSSRSYSQDQTDSSSLSNGRKGSLNSNGGGRSPSWGRVVKARKTAGGELQLEGVDNMVFEL